MSKYCSSCGKKVEEDTVYCPKCGEQINKSEPVNNQLQQVIHTKQCRFCMKEIDLDATGLVNPQYNVSCSSSINIVSTDEFNNN